MSDSKFITKDGFRFEIREGVDQGDFMVRRFEKNGKSFSSWIVGDNTDLLIAHHLKRLTRTNSNSAIAIKL